MGFFLNYKTFTSCFMHFISESSWLVCRLAHKVLYLKISSRQLLLFPVITQTAEDRLPVNLVRNGIKIETGRIEQREMLCHRADSPPLKPKCTI